MIFDTVLSVLPESLEPFAQNTSNAFANATFTNQSTSFVPHIVLQIVDVLIIANPLAFEGA